MIMRIDDETKNRVKDTDIVGWLALQGYHPSYWRGDVAWYKSPLRNERTPSFAVLTRQNKWVDYGGDGHRHDIIDLVREMYGVDFIGAVAILANGNFSLSRYEPITYEETKTEYVAYENIRELPIRTDNLCRYLAGRGITVVPRKEDIPQLSELHFNRQGGREQWHIGWRNDTGGYCIRRATDDKAATCKKFNIGQTDITTIRHGSDTCYLFEGFMDYLSFAVMNPPKASATDAIVLNSVSNKHLAVDAVQANAYTSVGLLLDRDDRGDKATEYIMSNLSTVDTKDWRHRIKHGKDVNDELVWRLHH